MPISYYDKEKIFKLDTATSSYVIGIYEENYILCLYYGKRIPDVPFDDYFYREHFPSFCPENPNIMNGIFSVDVAPMEYSGFGVGDFRKSAVAVRNSDGNDCTDLRYVSHSIFRGKKKLPGMPALFASEDECETLEILARDSVTGLEAVLSYTVFGGCGAMTKSVRLINSSDKTLDVERVYSSSVTLSSSDFDMLHLYGKHCQERHLERTPLTHGHTSVSSSRGSSSHFHNPFAAFAKHGAGEENGEVYGVNLVYSGNFDITADVDYYGTTRINAGINPDGFTWRLEPGEDFFTPEAVLVYTDEGLGEMSRIFHRLYTDHLIRGKWKSEKRPLLINSWEAAYFDFDDDKLVSFAERARELGIEMLVMDDGWFGKRNSDNCSLGDWYVNKEKLKGGLGSLIERVNALGLKFGIWYEPEMISPDSDLFRAHPDWCLHVPGRECSQGRRQYVIDMSRADVRENIYSQIKSVLFSYNIEYLKWDFNRNLTEAGSALLTAEHGEEIFHRFVLGTYEVMERLVSDFPNLLVENCSGGGGRFDPAMLCYSPQIWASDNTDAIERVSIQFGTSLCYPASTMGAHVSMDGRAPIETRGNVAMWGTFGYELDPNKLSARDCETVRRQVSDYHKYYWLVRNGDLYRIVSPWENEYYSAWEIVSRDKNEALFTLVNMRYHHCPYRVIRLRGLDENKYYRVHGFWDGKFLYSGAFLMNAGLNLSRMPRSDSSSYTFYITAEEKTAEE